MSKGLRLAVALTSALACTAPSTNCDNQDTNNKPKELESENKRLKQKIAEIQNQRKTRVDDGNSFAPGTWADLMMQQRNNKSRQLSDCIKRELLSKSKN